MPAHGQVLLRFLKAIPSWCLCLFQGENGLNLLTRAVSAVLPVLALLLVEGELAVLLEELPLEAGLLEAVPSSDQVVVVVESCTQRLLNPSNQPNQLSGR